MRKKDRRALTEYVRDTADRICLADWTIDVRVGGLDDDDHAAENDHTPQRLHATISFREDIMDWPPDVQKHVVAHELVHCHLAHLWEQIREDLQVPLGQHSYWPFVRSAERNLEHAVDQIALALCVDLPDIEWPD